MLIGKDYPKIELNISGLNLLEPNAMIGDLLIFIISVMFAIKILRWKNSNWLFKWWIIFFLIFGISFLMGGLGHLFYNYWGIKGKYFSWFAGMSASTVIELSMLNLLPKLNLRKYLIRISLFKLVICYLIEFIILYSLNTDSDPALGLIVPSIASFLGIGLTLGILARYFELKYSSSFRYFWISTLVLLPNVFIQSLKVNIHPFFDRNDLSHCLIIISLLFYYKALKGINARKLKNTKSK
jgi:hypothetical protein